MKISLSLLDFSGFTIEQLYPLWRSQCSILTELPIWDRATLSVRMTLGLGVCNTQAWAEEEVKPHVRWSRFESGNPGRGLITHTGWQGEKSSRLISTKPLSLSNHEAVREIFLVQSKPDSAFPVDLYCPVAWSGLLHGPFWNNLEPQTFRLSCLSLLKALWRQAWVLASTVVTHALHSTWHIAGVQTVLAEWTNKRRK